MPIEIKILRSGDEAVLDSVAPGVFDDPIDADATRRFLADARHHIAVALDGTLVVGFATGVHYFHPDKPVPELFINEVGVAPSHQRRGIAKRTLDALLAHGRALGCAQAWVLTDRGNPAAMHLYTACGGGEPSDQVMFSMALSAPDAQRSK
jgi:ribosomal protein S18 acetylase RimI-like enzyme